MTHDQMEKANIEEIRDKNPGLVAPLSELRNGTRGTVACLQAGADAGTIPKLIALGILPGCEVELLQRFPSYLFRIGHTQVAVDGSIAGSIRIRIDA